MPAPKRLKVGPATIKVRFSKDMPPTELGSFHPDEGILIDVHLSNGTLADVFLHEVLHALFHYFSLEEGRPEETQVGQMAALITTFWAANPSALRWWSSLLKE